jgi:hypothetical protein
MTKIAGRGVLIRDRCRFVCGMALSAVTEQSREHGKEVYALPLTCVRRRIERYGEAGPLSIGREASRDQPIHELS